ncbi:hypothetical protein [Chryseosolibacter indicus]|uniref:Uncharacterized protein n=1 Tax=Chryseosolibacter indicus TaxID=2782351 RepID=A0ABS5VMC0_9BACT|nr:hypothetical protein [Chryseosolibacter indicus]MBT1702595.1 hypothetical protein [Chryseosolibacter indicus]
MKRFLIWVLSLLIVGCIAAIIIYKFYLPGLVAKALIREEVPVLVPRYVKARIDQYKVPVNQGAEDVIKSIHRSDVSVEDLLEAIDDTDEEQFYAIVDEFNITKPKNTNEVFDLAKKHLNVDFDFEILREPFNKNIDMKLIRRGMGYANAYRNEQAIDPGIAKAVAKKILLQKEQEYNQEMSSK